MRWYSNAWACWGKFWGTNSASFDSVIAVKCPNRVKGRQAWPKIDQAGKWTPVEISLYRCHTVAAVPRIWSRRLSTTRKRRWRWPRASCQWSRHCQPSIPTHWSTGSSCSTWRCSLGSRRGYWTRPTCRLRFSYILLCSLFTTVRQVFSGSSQWRPARTHSRSWRPWGSPCSHF